jgi:hypothetical protein
MNEPAGQDAQRRQPPTAPEAQVGSSHHRGCRNVVNQSMRWPIATTKPIGGDGAQPTPVLPRPHHSGRPRPKSAKREKWGGVLSLL